MDVELRDLRWAVVASQHRSLRQAAQTLNVRIVLPPPKMIETFIESGLDRASVGDEAVRQMTRKQIDEAVAEIREKGMVQAVEADPRRECFQRTDL